MSSGFSLQRWHPHVDIPQMTEISIFFEKFIPAEMLEGETAERKSSKALGISQNAMSHRTHIISNIQEISNWKKFLKGWKERKCLEDRIHSQESTTLLWSSFSSHFNYYYSKPLLTYNILLHLESMVSLLNLYFLFLIFQVFFQKYFEISIILSET